MTKRLHPDVRRSEILDAALRMSRLHGYREVTREDISRAAKCSEALVSSYFGTMVQMRRAIVRQAVLQHDLTIIAQAVVAKDKHVMKADEGLRASALYDSLQ